MQRGCVSTLVASAKMARERSPESAIEAKSDDDRKLLLVAGVCAELVAEPMSAAQQSKLENDIGRIMPAPSIAITTFPGCKSSFPNAQDLGKQSGMEIMCEALVATEVLDLAMRHPSFRLGQPSCRDPKREPMGPRGYCCR